MGYILCASLVSYGIDWRYSFYIQAVCFIPTILSIMLTPSKYFDLEKAIEQRQ
jgi:sugar phosphate permease